MREISHVLWGLAIAGTMVRLLTMTKEDFEATSTLDRIAAAITVVVGLVVILVESAR